MNKLTKQVERTYLHLRAERENIERSEYVKALQNLQETWDKLSKKQKA